MRKLVSPELCRALFALVCGSVLAGCAVEGPVPTGQGGVFLPRMVAAADGQLGHPKQPITYEKYPLDKHLYAQRHLVECCFSKLKQFRRVATRYEKTAHNYRAIITLAAIMLWIR